MSGTIVTRFAPSPTGDLHLGGARTALFSYALARGNGGRFALRIEDTDIDRNSDASRRGILEAMRWLGLGWDGDVVMQSERLDRHREALDVLVARDAAYPAFETPEDLEAARRSGRRVYDGPSRRMAPEDARKMVMAGVPHVWRLRTPDDGVLTIADAVRGPVSFPMSGMSDPVIWRSRTDTPLYNLACAVDDLDEGVTHVIRGEEHLTNTVTQALIRLALGRELPVWAHLPVVTRDGRKMSKRDPVRPGSGPVGVLGRRDMGWTAEGVINHLALLGWSRPDPDASEIFGLDTFVSEFSLDRVRPSASNFDEKKAAYVQKAWLGVLSPEDLTRRISDIVPGFSADPAHVAMAAPKARDLLQIVSLVAPIRSRPEPVRPDFSEVPASALENVCRLITGSGTPPSWADIVAASEGADPRKVAGALRGVLAGGAVSIDLVSLIEAIGTAEAGARIRTVLEDAPEP